MDLPEIAIDEFIRRASIRAPKWMWLLGAGTSAGAAIPTAQNMIWDFKRFLYRTAEGITPQALEDLSNPAVRTQVQGYFDAEGTHPASGSPEEYAHFFELAYPDVSDRRTYIEAKAGDARPSYGHLCLSALLKAERARVVWTTNFDRLVEDGCAKIFGTTSKLTVATIDNGEVAGQAISEDRWPLLGKLHGDFASRRLKNTSDELRQQDAKLRRALIEASKRLGLIVAGYSGRDDSVMRALEEACVEGAFPPGLFWLQYGGEEPSDRVARLIHRAEQAGVDSAVVQIGTFDEALGDLIRQEQGLEATLAPHLSDRRRQVSNAPLASKGSGWPVVRTNALEVAEWPTICRRVACEVGGARDVREAVKAASIDALATRTRAGVLAFGSDADLRRAFDRFHISEFDLHPIEKRRFYSDTQERGLILDALARALTRERPLRLERRRSSCILIPEGFEGEALRPLEKEARSIRGNLKRSSLEWREALTLHLDFHFERLWLLLEPQLWFERPDGPAARAEAADFGRERFARRYNSQWNALVDAWIQVLLGDRSGTHLKALGVADGVDAVFRLGETTAFSRAGSRHAP